MRARTTTSITVVNWNYQHMRKNLKIINTYTFCMMVVMAVYTNTQAHASGAELEQLSLTSGTRISSASISSAATVSASATFSSRTRGRDNWDSLSQSSPLIAQGLQEVSSRTTEALGGLSYRRRTRSTS